MGWGAMCSFDVRRITIGSMRVTWIGAEIVHIG